MLDPCRLIEQLRPGAKNERALKQDHSGNNPLFFPPIWEHTEKASKILVVKQKKKKENIVKVINQGGIKAITRVQ